MEFKTQEEYLLALAEAIKYLNPKDATKVLQYYQTRITNAIEYGEKEEDVIRRLPDVETVAKETYESHGVNYLEMRKKQLKRKQIFNNITGVIISFVLLAVFLLVMFLIGQTIFNMGNLLIKTFTNGKGIDKFITPIAIILYILCELVLTIYLVDLFIIMISNFLSPVIKLKDETAHRKLFTFTITGFIEEKTNHNKVQIKLIVSLIVLFLICLGVSYTQKGYFKNSLENIPSNKTIYELPNELEEITINGYNGNIYFKHAEDDKLTLEHQYEFEHSLNQEVKDNKLNIALEITKSYDILNILTEPTQNIIIYVPKNHNLANINITMDTSIIDFTNIYNKELEININIESKGTVSSAYSTFDTLNVEGYDIAFGIAETLVFGTLNVKSTNGQTLIQQQSLVQNLKIENGSSHVRLEDSYINNLEITNNSGPIYANKLTGTNFKLTSKASTNDIVNSTYNSYTFDISNAAVLTLKQSICTGATEDEKIKVTASSANIAFTNVKGNIEITGEANYIYFEGIGSNVICPNIQEDLTTCDDDKCPICTHSDTNINNYNESTFFLSSIKCSNSGKTSKIEIIDSQLTKADLTQNQGFFNISNNTIIESSFNCTNCQTVDIIDLKGETCNLYFAKIETSIVIDAKENTNIKFIVKSVDTISMAVLMKNDQTIDFTIEGLEENE